MEPDPLGINTVENKHSNPIAVAMIQVAPGTKVHLACRPVSMRYGFDGLCAKVAAMGARTRREATAMPTARPTTFL